MINCARLMFERMIHSRVNCHCGHSTGNLPDFVYNFALDYFIAALSHKRCTLPYMYLVLSKLESLTCHSR